MPHSTNITMTYLRDNQTTFYNYSNIFFVHTSAAFFIRNLSLLWNFVKLIKPKYKQRQFFFIFLTIDFTNHYLEKCNLPKGNWTESNTIIVLDRTEIKVKKEVTFFYCTNSFIIIKVELPIDNAQMKTNEIQVINFIAIMKNAICKRDVVSKCNTTIVFD